jgi:hypothetical protein
VVSQDKEPDKKSIGLVIENFSLGISEVLFSSDMSQFYSSFTLTLRAVKRFVQSYNMS